MRKVLFFILLVALTTVSCKHKPLSDEDPCRTGNIPVKVVVDWNGRPELARSMRINLFSQTPGTIDYGRDEVPASGTKYIYLNGGASYRPFCYDYNSTNIYFRNEQNLDSFEAYFSGMSRTTYDQYAAPVTGEPTYSAPSDGEFYLHAWTTTFDVEANSTNEQVLIFKPENVLRQFTYRVNNISGSENIKDVRGAASGMSAVFIFKTNLPSDVRSTMLFGNVLVGYDKEKKYGFLEGEFYTFGPMEPYINNWFTIELYSNANKYHSASWDASPQIKESMEDRAKKLADDGYDILLWNDPDTDIPDIDPGEGSGSGFDIGVGEWADEVIVKL